MSTRGRYGQFGGQFLPETLMPAIAELEAAFDAARADEAFQQELDRLLREWVGRPTPLSDASRLAKLVGLRRVMLKREDLDPHRRAQDQQRARAGAPRAADGEAAHRRGDRRGPARRRERGRVRAPRPRMRRVHGHRGHAPQAPNVFRMRLLGAEVRAVDAGSRTLKDAVNEAIRDWVTNVRTTYYLLGSAIGPHPYPTMVREFQSDHRPRGARAVARARRRAARVVVVACVGGGSNAIGMFSAFLDDDDGEAARR